MHQSNFISIIKYQKHHWHLSTHLQETYRNAFICYDHYSMTYFWFSVIQLHTLSPWKDFTTCLPSCLRFHGNLGTQASPSSVYSACWPDLHLPLLCISKITPLFYLAKLNHQATNPLLSFPLYLYFKFSAVSVFGSALESAIMYRPLDLFDTNRV